VLVMRRRSGEGFTIGEDIEIEVLEVSGTRVKLGIKAPESCIIVRREIRITQDENRTASRGMDASQIGSLVRGVNLLTGSTLTTKPQTPDQIPQKY